MLGSNRLRVTRLFIVGPACWGVGILHQNCGTALQASDDSAVVGESRAERRRSLGKRAWARWLRFAEIVGTVQMVIILTLVYWTVVAAMAIPFKILADPLGFKRPRGWTPGRQARSDLDWMKEQY